MSRNRSLRQLEITAYSLRSVLKDHSPAATASSFKAMLSTIRSPAFSCVTVIYQQDDFSNNLSRKDTSAGLGDERMWYYGQFELFRAMHEARPYRLVSALIRVGDDSVRELNRVLDVEEAKGGCLCTSRYIILCGSTEDEEEASTMVLSTRILHRFGSGSGRRRFTVRFRAQVHQVSLEPNANRSIGTLGPICQHPSCQTGGVATRFCG